MRCCQFEFRNERPHIYIDIQTDTEAVTSNRKLLAGGKHRRDNILCYKYIYIYFADLQKDYSHKKMVELTSTSINTL